MKFLCVDVGTGTQDILLYDTDMHPENGFKLVVPSPTMMVRRRLQAATRAGQPVLLTGLTMGGGPSHWAVEDHLKAGYAVYATPAAARSFNDDLDYLQSQGIEIVSEDEADGLPDGLRHLQTRDFDYAAIRSTFTNFGVSLEDLDAVAVAVFDHGNAPPDMSDRKFRFDYIARRVAADRQLTTFAFARNDIPSIMTRMQAVAAAAGDVDAPLLLMDTAPAAVAGALLDGTAHGRSHLLVANLGNLHTLAFHMGPDGIAGTFEHHTGMLDQDKMDGLLRALADGTLRNEEVFDDHGHGALIVSETPYQFPIAGPGVVVTGPRRGMMVGSPLRPYFATPFGDMMLAGCFGLLTAIAARMPQFADPIRASLQGNRGRPPWEL